MKNSTWRCRLDARRNTIVVLLVAGLLVAGCGGGSDDESSAGSGEGNAGGEALVIDGVEIADSELWAAAQEEGAVTLYAGRPEDVFLPIKEAFEEQTGLEITQVRLPGSQMFERVISEYSAGALEADYFDLSDLSHMDRILGRDMVISHKVPSFDELPDTGKEPEGRFYVVWNPLMTLGYNSALVSEDEAPREWSDLLDERWRGKVGFSHIDVGGSSWSFNMMLRQNLGEDTWQRFADNETSIYPSSVPLLEDVVRGEILVNANGLSQLAEQQLAGAPIEIVFPSEGVAAFPTTGAIPKSAPHPNAAKVWMNWITSPAGGAAVAQTGAFGAHPESPTPVMDTFEFPAWDDLNVYVPTMVQTSELREELSAEWRATFEVE